MKAVSEEGKGQSNAVKEQSAVKGQSAVKAVEASLHETNISDHSKSKSLPYSTVCIVWVLRVSSVNVSISESISELSYYFWLYYW